MKRLLALGVASIVLIGAIAVGITGFSSSSDIKKYENQQNQLKDQIRQINQDKSRNKSQQNELSDKISAMEDAIIAFEDQINALGVEVKGTEKQIQVKSVELDIAENNITNKKITLNARLRVMYKTGNMGYLEVLLGSKDIADLMTRIDAVQKIYQHDTDMLRYLIDQRNIVNNAKRALEGYRETLRRQVMDKEAAQANLNMKASELEVARAQLQEQYQVLDEQEDKLRVEADKLTRILSAMKPTGNYIGGIMAWPTPGYGRITSPFGYRIHPISKVKKLHTGIDVGVPSGTKVVAAQSGTVLSAGWLGGYGKVVMVDHGGGIVTLYAHNSSLSVSAGEKVSQGQEISRSGNTGMSTGPHLHFEVRVNGQYVDPLKYVAP